MSVRVGMNGFGRIGRNCLRCVLERAETGTGTPVEVVAVNDLTSPATPAHLPAYDSTYGRLGRTVEHDDASLTVDGHRITVTAERDPAALPRCDLGVAVVIESTGRFRTREDAGLHLKAGARKVLLSVPGKGVDATVVMGVDEGTYDPERDHVVSNASCTCTPTSPPGRPGTPASTSPRSTAS